VKVTPLHREHLPRSIGEMKEQWGQYDLYLTGTKHSTNRFYILSVLHNFWTLYFTVFRLFDCSIEQINKFAVTLKRLLNLMDKTLLLGR